MQTICFLFNDLSNLFGEDFDVYPTEEDEMLRGLEIFD